MFTALTCQPDGTILTLIRDDCSLTPALAPGVNWLTIVNPDSVEAADHFLEEIRSSSSAVCSLQMNYGDRSNQYKVFGFSANDIISVIISLEQILQQVDNIHAGSDMERQNSGSKPEDIQLKDLARLNNELVDLQHQLQQSDNDLKHKQNTLERIFRASPDILIVTNLKTQQIVLQNREIDVLRDPSTDNLSSILTAEIHPDDHPKVKIYLDKLESLINGDISEIEFRIHDSENNWFWFFRRDTVFSVNPDGSAREILSLFQDITEKQNARQILYQMSTRDALTNLYNRVYFNQELERLQDSRLYPISILVADVDGLKPINDAFGHAAGDILIQRAGEVLRKTFRNEDVVARFGGDEFGVILAKTSADDMPNILARLNTYLDEYNSDMTQTEIRLSIGFATADKGDQLGQILREADVRMYAEKTERKLYGY
ncbi:MAG: sensor domain-containing diguanylate cyclase [Anaerolineales bacterium]|nr:sensor domain-containing diguanylate cyclase [Anaerolineales bacterium]